MASSYTTNYQLPIWAASDSFLRTEFNDANQKIDAAIAQCGNCHMVTGSYVGTGVRSVSLDFADSLGAAPKLLIVRAAGDDSGGQGLILMPGMTRTFYTLAHSMNSSYFLDLIWTATGVSWSGDSAHAALCENGVTYFYLALG